MGINKSGKKSSLRGMEQGFGEILSCLRLHPGSVSVIQGVEEAQRPGLNAFYHYEIIKIKKDKC